MVFFVCAVLGQSSWWRTVPVTWIVITGRGPCLPLLHRTTPDRAVRPGFVKYIHHLGLKVDDAVTQLDQVLE